MKYVFWGSPRFAEIVLKKTIELNVPPVAVVCNPDRPAGRDQKMTPPPVKELAEANGIKVFQPERPEDIINELADLDSDFFVIAAYAKIVSQTILDIPRLGTIGVHPSLLPKYRGAAPIQEAILRGERESGVTLYKVDEKMDHGAILGQKTAIISGLGYLEAEKALAELGGDMLGYLIPEFLEGRINLQLQDHSQATFTRKITTEDGRVELDSLKAALNGDQEKAEDIRRRILAYNPEPGVYTETKKGRVKLLQAEPDGERLTLTKIQLEGKKPTENFDDGLFT